ncbi:hypothetical protein BJY01DRAFT_250478 [Aspergillus pseudoustus]|uniref:Lung seven transmembrane receptor-domain-containing protein n=1 Tax=Aspergillus pseudoustus TaxID=1810923 RepID=A0ABR4JHQ3_9EURO
MNAHSLLQTQTQPYHSIAMSVSLTFADAFYQPDRGAGLGIGALVLRRKRNGRRFNFQQLPQWAVLGLLWANFLFAILTSVRIGIFMNDPLTPSESLEDYNNAGNIISFFFLYAGNCALIYILYRLLYLVLTECPKTEAPSARLRKIHWGLLGLAITMSIVTWGLQAKNQLMPAAYTSGLIFSDERVYMGAYAGLDTATYLVRLGISGEILWRSIQLCIKTLGKRSQWRTPSILLVLSATFFLALNLTWVICDIRWRIVPVAMYVGQTIAYEPGFYAADTCQIVFYLIIYIGLIWFCLRWGWLARKEVEREAERDEKDELERAKLPPEADSNPKQLAEADGRAMEPEIDSVPVNEADSAPLVEMEAKALVPPVELDSTEVRK